jgi:signal transduction histidine kinase
MASAAAATVTRAGVGRPREIREGRAGFVHAVQFYDGDAFLADVVSEFLLAGARAGEPLVVVATGAHRAAFVQRMESEGLDVEQATAAGRLTLLDARETLSRLLVGGTLDRGRFDEVVAELAETLAARGAIGSLRCYGEMVDLLWRDGNQAEALLLEGWWNEVRALGPLSLLCGYALSGFRRAADTASLHEICAHHTRVWPTAGFERTSAQDERLREISLLEQREQALEIEIERRKAVERELHLALRVRDDFFAAAGHELRTPLTIIRLHLGSLQSAIKDDGDERVGARIARTVRETERLTALIDQLLDVTRVGAGRLSLQRATFDLSTLVREVVGRSAEAAAHARCTLSVQADEAVVGTWDSTRLECVMANLLSNAIKYGQGTPVEIRVEQDSGVARVAVRDGGAGLSASDQERVFQRFQRGAEPGVGGLGIGLWIARQIVEAHGGTIRVSSELGKGSTFVVVLPLDPCSWPDEAA